VAGALGAEVLQLEVVLCLGLDEAEGRQGGLAQKLGRKLLDGLAVHLIAVIQEDQLRRALQPVAQLADLIGQGFQHAARTLELRELRVLPFDDDREGREKR
jgi:hypothetical protein